MNQENMTPASEAVANAIWNHQEYNGGMGASIEEIAEATGMDPKAIRGNLADLVKRELVYVDLKKHSGASCDMWYRTDYID